MSSIDVDVVTRVTNALLGDLAWKGVIDVRCRDGVVKLAGIAASERSRQAAEAIASQQLGVVAVVNQLYVSTGLERPITRRAW
jgi:osmotically-inducible protein OsmY